MYVALVTQLMRHNVVSGLSGPNKFFHIISQTVRFSKKKKCYYTQNVFVDFLYKFCLKHVLFFDKLSWILS